MWTAREPEHFVILKKGPSRTEEVVCRELHSSCRFKLKDDTPTGFYLFYNLLTHKIENFFLDFWRFVKIIEEQYNFTNCPECIK